MCRFTIKAVLISLPGWSHRRDLTGMMYTKKFPSILSRKSTRPQFDQFTYMERNARLRPERHEQTLHATEIKILIWSFSLTRLDRQRNPSVRQRLGIAPIESKIFEARVWWYGHVQRRDRNSLARTAIHLEVSCTQENGLHQV